jgi:hypothetical protein
MRLFQNLLTHIVELAIHLVYRTIPIHSEPIPPKLKTISLDFILYNFSKRVIAVNSKRADGDGPVMAK